MKKTLSFLIAMVFVFSALAPAALAEGEDTLSTALSYIFPADGPRDPQAALELLLPLAEAGDADAQYYCGWKYDLELEENMDTEAEAYKWYVLAAAQDHVKANVGAALNSFSESFDDYMNRAFELGFWTMEGNELGADGYFWQGFMYYYGYGVEQQPDIAYIYYSAAAEMNSPVAMCNLGVMHENGTGAEYDINASRMWYRSAADRGYTPAMLNLGYSYYFSGSEENYEQAFEMFYAAAELGDASAMAQLGQMYQSGEGTEENPELAFEWYSRAVELGDTHAMCMLGHMYRDGDWVEQDYDKAMNYFIEAAVNGNTSAPYVVEMMKAYNEGMAVYNERKAEYLAATAD